MDKYAAAVRKYLLQYFAGYGEVIDGKIVHVHFVDEWKGYRLYDHWIDDGRVDEPAYPPIYIMVDKDCNVRWMTKKEAYDYQEEKDMILLAAENRFAAKQKEIIKTNKHNLL